MTLTHTQHAILRTMADGDWHLGSTLTKSGGVLADMCHIGMIKPAGKGNGYMFDLFSITPAGEIALEATT